MYVEYVALFDYYLKNLEEVLRTSTNNKHPLRAKIAREARIYAFKKCAEALQQVLFSIYDECEEGEGPEDMTDVLNKIEELNEEWIEKQQVDDEEEGLSDATKVLMAFQSLGTISLSDSLNLSKLDVAPEVLTTPLELVPEEEREEFSVEYTVLFDSISRFYYSANRLKTGFIMYRTYRELE